APERVRGTRDRSWGIRPIGAADAQPTLPLQMPQFFWLWAPLNFDDYITLYHRNDDAAGKPWNTRAVLAALGSAAGQESEDVGAAIDYRSGTRRVRRLRIELRQHGSVAARIQVEPQWHFYMPGLGYMHPEWGHGLYKGELAVGYDSYDRATTDDAVPGMMHIQAFSRAELELAGGERQLGSGIVEQLILGPHAPSGLRELFDPAA
ncbi:MAG TPA: hypothetical protein VEB21_06680, partial [Terriglobales bacterium]|nr:hypothetical protein [Terriglobales bacterium]